MKADRKDDEHFRREHVTEGNMASLTALQYESTCFNFRNLRIRMWLNISEWSVSKGRVGHKFKVNECVDNSNRSMLRTPVLM